MAKRGRGSSGEPLLPLYWPLGINPRLLLQSRDEFLQSRVELTRLFEMAHVLDRDQLRAKDIVGEELVRRHGRAFRQEA